MEKKKLAKSNTKKRILPKFEVLENNKKLNKQKIIIKPEFEGHVIMSEVRSKILRPKMQSEEINTDNLNL